MESSASGRGWMREVVPAVGILLATWVLMWLAQDIPTMCALAYPCPAGDVRVAPALTFGGLMLLPVAVLILRALVGRPRGEGAMIAAYVLLVGLAVGGLAAVLFSGGFGIHLPFG